MTRSFPRAARVVAAVGAVLLGTAPALASTGVAVDVGRITVEQDLTPGAARWLPAFGVRNPGTETTTYRLVVHAQEPGADQDGTTASPPASWIEFAPSELTLPPQQSAPVRTRLVIPPDAELGRYEVLIGPDIVAPVTGAHVGAGAAVGLTFTVSDEAGVGGWLRWFGRVLAEHPWALALPGLLAAFVALRFLRRRFEFSVARRG